METSENQQTFDKVMAQTWCLPFKYGMYSILL